MSQSTLNTKIGFAAPLHTVVSAPPTYTARVLTQIAVLFFIAFNACNVTTVISVPVAGVDTAVGHLAGPDNNSVNRNSFLLNVVATTALNFVILLMMLQLIRGGKKPLKCGLNSGKMMDPIICYMIDEARFQLCLQANTLCSIQNLSE